MPSRRRFDTRRFIRNCVPSRGVDRDWGLAAAVDAGAVRLDEAPPSRDLRAAWWPVRDQGSTGACVGFAAADGVLRWHYVTAGWIGRKDLPSPRFIWMANKETDEYTEYPTTFIEGEGTYVKLALANARKFGCVLERDLPIEGGLSRMTLEAFYTRASALRIASYHNLGRDLGAWRSWIANQGPILSCLDVDRTWERATETGGVLERYLPRTVNGGHAISLVGYTKDGFIVRNSWGKGWGDRGFAHATDAYAAAAFTEAYGAVL